MEDGFPPSSRKMSTSLIPLDKLNVFSIAAGFFFLTAAALSAFLVATGDGNAGTKEEDHHHDIGAGRRTRSKRVGPRSAASRGLTLEDGESLSINTDDLIDTDSCLDEDEDCGKLSFLEESPLEFNVSDITEQRQALVEQEEERQQKRLAPVVGD